ncbi:immunity protein YezG family protein [Anoxybacteroides amylolyticum]|uniref:immunity protein YezG family protein n=1 Tax=Anoxybacteroides amylolyticum TaxID=294699 RepID=UPI000A014160|nr:immunity protein YezG family protein [Anoxybacillus amylolyticus]
MIPEKWKKILLYAEFREGYKKIFFYYYPMDREEPVYSLDIPDLYTSKLTF